MSNFEPVKTPNAPYKSYALYARPGSTPDAPGEVVLLSADAEDQRLYHNKGFEFLGFARAPGATTDTIDWRPWPVTTDGHVIPWNAGPVVPNLPTSREQTRAMGADPEGMNAMVNMPVLAQAAGSGARGVNQAAESDDQEGEVRKKLEKMNVPKEQVDAALARIHAGTVRPYAEVVEGIRRSSALPGLEVEKGVTRGVRGLDVSMPSPIPGIPAHDREGLKMAEERGELRREEYEVSPGVSTERLVATDALRERLSGGGATAAPGDTSSGAASSPATEQTNVDDARHAQVRQEAMRSEGEAKNPPSSQDKSRSAPSRRR